MCGYSIAFIQSGVIFGFKELYLVVMFWVLFYITSLFSVLREKGTTEKVDGIVAVLNAGFSLLWIISQASHELAPIIIACVGLVYAIGFFIVYKVTNVYTSFIVYGCTSLGLLTTAIMLQLSGRSETLALLLIGAGATVLTYYLSKNEHVTGLVACFNILPLVYVMRSIDTITRATYGGQGLVDAWQDILILALTIGIYFSLFGYFVGRVRRFGYVAFWVAIVLSVIGLWQLLHLMMSGGVATFVSILIYTIIGLIVLFTGTQHKNDLKVTIAKYWLGLVAARVIFWDAWQVGSVALGVLICIVIGVLLLSSTFIIKKVSKENE
jgi:hypothetical protein